MFTRASYAVVFSFIFYHSHGMSTEPSPLDKTLEVNTYNQSSPRKDFILRHGLWLVSEYAIQDGHKLKGDIGQGRLFSPVIGVGYPLALRSGPPGGQITNIINVGKFPLLAGVDRAPGKADQSSGDASNASDIDLPLGNVVAQNGEQSLESPGDIEKFSASDENSEIFLLPLEDEPFQNISNFEPQKISLESVPSIPLSRSPVPSTEEDTNDIGSPKTGPDVQPDTYSFYSSGFGSSRKGNDKKAEQNLIAQAENSPLVATPGNANSFSQADPSGNLIGLQQLRDNKQNFPTAVLDFQQGRPLKNNQGQNVQSDSLKPEPEGFSYFDSSTTLEAIKQFESNLNVDEVNKLPNQQVFREKIKQLKGSLQVLSTGFNQPGNGVLNKGSNKGATQLDTSGLANGQIVFSGTVDGNKPTEIYSELRDNNNLRPQGVTTGFNQLRLSPNSIAPQNGEINTLHNQLPNPYSNNQGPNNEGANSLGTNNGNMYNLGTRPGDVGTENPYHGGLRQVSSHPSSAGVHNAGFDNGGSLNMVNAQPPPLRSNPGLAANDNNNFKQPDPHSINLGVNNVGFNAGFNNGGHNTNLAGNGNIGAEFGGVRNSPFGNIVGFNNIGPDTAGVNNIGLRQQDSYSDIQGTRDSRINSLANDKENFIQHNSFINTVENSNLGFQTAGTNNEIPRQPDSYSSITGKNSVPVNNVFRLSFNNNEGSNRGVDKNYGLSHFNSVNSNAGNQNVNSETFHINRLRQPELQANTAGHSIVGVNSEVLDNEGFRHPGSYSSNAVNNIIRFNNIRNNIVGVRNEGVNSVGANNVGVNNVALNNEGLIQYDSYADIPGNKNIATNNVALNNGGLRLPDSFRNNAGNNNEGVTNIGLNNEHFIQPVAYPNNAGNNDAAVNNAGLNNEGFRQPVASPNNAGRNNVAVNNAVFNNEVFRQQVAYTNNAGSNNVGFNNIALNNAEFRQSGPFTSNVENNNVGINNAALNNEGFRQPNSYVNNARNNNVGFGNIALDNHGLRQQNAHPNHLGNSNVRVTAISLNNEGFRQPHAYPNNARNNNVGFNNDALFRQPDSILNNAVNNDVGLNNIAFNNEGFRQPDSNAKNDGNNNLAMNNNGGFRQPTSYPNNSGNSNVGVSSIESNNEGFKQVDSYANYAGNENFGNAGVNHVALKDGGFRQSNLDASNVGDNNVVLNHEGLKNPDTHFNTAGINIGVEDVFNKGVFRQSDSYANNLGSNGAHINNRNVYDTGVRQQELFAVSPLGNNIRQDNRGFNTEGLRQVGNNNGGFSNIGFSQPNLYDNHVGNNNVGVNNGISDTVGNFQHDINIGIANGGKHKQPTAYFENRDHNQFNGNNRGTQNNGLVPVNIHSNAIGPDGAQEGANFPNNGGFNDPDSYTENYRSPDSRNLIASSLNGAVISGGNVKEQKKQINPYASNVLPSKPALSNRPINIEGNQQLFANSGISGGTAVEGLKQTGSIPGAMGNDNFRNFNSNLNALGGIDEKINTETETPLVANPGISGDDNVGSSVGNLRQPKFYNNNAGIVNLGFNGIGFSGEVAQNAVGVNHPDSYANKAITNDLRTGFPVTDNGDVNQYSSHGHPHVFTLNHGSMNHAFCNHHGDAGGLGSGVTNEVRQAKVQNNLVGNRQIQFIKPSERDRSSQSVDGFWNNVSIMKVDEKGQLRPQSQILFFRNKQSRNVNLYSNMENNIPRDLGITENGMGSGSAVSIFIPRENIAQGDNSERRVDVPVENFPDTKTENNQNTPTTSLGTRHQVPYGTILRQTSGNEQAQLNSNTQFIRSTNLNDVPVGFPEKGQNTGVKGSPSVIQADLVKSFESLPVDQMNPGRFEGPTDFMNYKPQEPSFNAKPDVHKLAGDGGAYNNKAPTGNFANANMAGYGAANVNTHNEGNVLGGLDITPARKQGDIPHRIFNYNSEYDTSSEGDIGEIDDTLYRESVENLDKKSVEEISIDKVEQRNFPNENDYIDITTENTSTKSGQFGDVMQRANIQSDFSNNGSEIPGYEINESANADTPNVQHEQGQAEFDTKDSGGLGLSADHKMQLNNEEGCGGEWVPIL